MIDPEDDAGAGNKRAIRSDGSKDQGALTGLLSGRTYQHCHSGGPGNRRRPDAPSRDGSTRPDLVRSGGGRAGGYIDTSELGGAPDSVQDSQLWGDGRTVSTGDVDDRMGAGQAAGENGNGRVVAIRYGEDQPDKGRVGRGDRDSQDTTTGNSDGKIDPTEVDGRHG